MNDDQWSVDGLRISDEEVMSKIRYLLEEGSEIIVEHRFHRGARSPHRFICGSSRDFEIYIRENSRPGDSFWIWSCEQVCQDQNSIVSGAKIPDSHGRVPKTGAY